MAFVKRAHAQDPLSSAVQIFQSRGPEYDSLRNVNCIILEKLLVQDSSGNTVVRIDGTSGLTGSGSAANKVEKTGDTMSGNLDMTNSSRVVNVLDPVAAQDVATKNYVDTATNTLTFVNVNSSTTLTANAIHLVDVSGGSVTLTLPASPAAGTIVEIVDSLGFVGVLNTITVNASGGNTINEGITSFTITAQSSRTRLIFDATSGRWYGNLRIDMMHSEVSLSGVGANLLPGNVYRADTSGGIGSGALPLASTTSSTTGNSIIIMDSTGSFSTNNFTVNVSGADVIRQAGQASQTSMVLSTDYQMVRFHSNEAGVWIVEYLNTSASGAFLPLAGGTMTGAIAMGTNKITGAGDPTAAQDVATKNYTDTTFLPLAGGTMTGNIIMGSNLLSSVARSNREIDIYGTLVANVSLTSTSKHYQHVTNGTNFNMILPDATTLPPGWVVEIFTTASSQNFGIQNFGGTTLASLFFESRAKAVLIDNGSANGTWFVLASSGAASPPLTTININSATTLLANTQYHVDTTGGAYTVTLPTAPADGTCVQIVDVSGIFDTNNLIVSRGGADLIEGGVTSLVLNQPNAYAEFCYDDGLNQWIVRGKPLIGATSGTAGRHGLVPVPLAGDQNAVLLGDATWSRLPITKQASISAAGPLEASTRYHANTGLGAFAVTLPDASTVSNSTEIEIIDDPGNFIVNNLTVNTTGGNVITDSDGNVLGASTTLVFNFMVARFISNGATSWRLVRSHDRLKLPLAGGTMTGAIAMGTNKITGLGDPTVAQDAATKNYVDAQISSSSLIAPVEVKTDAALPAYTQAGAGVGATLTATANGAFPAVDGITLSTIGDRILVDTLGSATDDDNGVYTLTQVGDGSNPWVLTRATDYDDNTKVLHGTHMFVKQGTACAGCGFVLTGTGAITVDTSLLTFTQFANPTGYVLKTGDTMTGELAMSTNKITGMGDPTAAQDAATKIYVDSLVSGLTLISPVEVKTVAALPAYTQAGAGIGATLTATANGAFPAVDGITLSTIGDRILVDTDGSATDDDNGVYTLTQVGDGSNPWVLTRATDYDENTEIVYGSHVFVKQGTFCAGCGYVLTGTGAITVDTTTLTFTQFSSPLGFVAKTGDTMSGALDMGTTNKIVNLADPTVAQDAVTKNYADNTFVDVAGDSMTGALAMGTNKITGMGDPTAAQDAATKIYVDTADSFSCQNFSTITADPAPAVTRTRYLCDTSGAAFAVTIPAGTTPGEWIDIIDSNRSFATNNLTINRSGADQFFLAAIPGVGVNSLVLDDNDTFLRLTYITTNQWLIVIYSPTQVEGPAITVTADPAPALSNSRYMADTGGGAFSITLPDSTTVALGTAIEVFDENGTFATNNLTVARSGTDLIFEPGVAGATSLVLNTDHDSRKFVRVASQRWLVVGSSGSSSALTVSNISADPAPAAVSTEYHADTSGGVFTVTLPTAPVDGSHIRLIDSNNSFPTNNLTVARGGSDTIQGGISLTLSALGAVVDLYYEAATADWKVASHSVPAPVTLQTSAVALASNVNIFFTSYQTILDITLPSAGTYSIVADISANINNNGATHRYVFCELFNVTTATSILATETSIVSVEYDIGGSSITSTGSGAINTVITTTGADTIRLRGRVNDNGAGSTSANALGGTDGRTRMRYIQLPTSTITNVAFPAEYSRAILTAAQTTNLSIGDPLRFDSIQNETGSSATYNVGTFQWTLLANKTYRLSADVTRINFSLADSEFTFQWRDQTGGTDLGTPGSISSHTSSANVGWGSDASAIFIPSVDSVVECVVKKNTNVVAVGDSNNGSNGGAYGFIEILADNNKVSTFTGATAGTAGVQGLVPTPAAGDQNAVLLGDATWSRLPVTKSAAISADPAPADISTRYSCDTSGGAFTVTLPDSASTTIGTVVEVLDAKQSFNTNNLTVARSGVDEIYESGQAAATSLVLSDNNAHRRFILGESLKWFVEAAGSGGAAMTGATSGTPGTSGSVPVPVAGDQNAVLSGDATWSRLPVTKLQATTTDPAPAEIGVRYACDTTSAPFAVTLPDSASTDIGAVVEVLDAKQFFNTNNLTVGVSGSDMIYESGGGGVSTSVVISDTNAYRRFVLGESLKWFMESSGGISIENVTLDPTPAVVSTEYHADTTGGAFNITLPTAPLDGSHIRIIDSNGNFATNALTVLPGGANTIRGAASLVLSDNHTVIDLYYEAGTTDWKVSNNIMTGATSGTAGFQGLVPTPAAGDQNKVLRGDGTWGQSLAVSNVNVDPAPAVVGTSYHADTSGGVFTITLPTAPVDGAHIQIIDSNGTFSNNNLTVAAGGADTIQGSPNVLLVDDHAITDFYYDVTTTAWKVANHSLPVPTILGRASITRNAAQSIPTSTVTDVDFDNTVYSIGSSMTVNTGAGANITINKDGIYHITGSIGFATHASANISAILRIDGVTIRDISDDPTIKGRLDVSATEQLTTGQVITYAVFQSTGGNLNTSTVLASRPRLDVFELPTASVSNVAQAAEYSRAILSSAQTTNLAVNDPIRFNTIQNETGDSVTYNVGTFTWTLLANKTYRLSADITRINFSAISSELTWQWRDQTGAADLGIAGSMASHNNGSTVGWGSDASAIFTPTVNSSVQCIIKKSASVTGIGDGNSGANGGAYGFIEVLSDNSKVTAFTGATAGTAGLQGLVKAPSAGDENAVLVGDATWSGIPITKQGTVSGASTLSDGVRYAVDTSGGSFVLTLPFIANVPLGAQIEVFDAKQSFSTNSLTVSANIGDSIYETGQASTTSISLSDNSAHRVFYAGEANKWFVKAAGSGGLTTVNVTADPAPAAVSTSYHANTSGGAFTITLPTAPSDGDMIRIIDANNTFDTNNLTIAPGGADTIQGAAGNVIVTNRSAVIDLHYEAATTDWKITNNDNPSPTTVASFKARKSTTQALSNGVATAITNYTTTDFDNLGNFNATTGEYTVPRTAQYMISVGVGFILTPAATSTFQVGIALNGSTAIIDSGAVGYSDASGSNAIIAPQLTKLYSLAAGDVVRMIVQQNNGGAENLGTDDRRNYFSIQEMPSFTISNVAQASEYMQIIGSGTQDNVVLNDRVVLDTVLESGGNSISAAGSIFTLLSGRTYKMYGHARLAGTSPSGSISYSWYDITNATEFGTTGSLFSTDSTTTGSFTIDAIGVISPTSDITVELRIVFVSASGVMDLLPARSVALIEVLSDNIKVSAMSGASAGASGLQGLVPTPITGEQNAVLTGDASWSKLPVTRLSAITADPAPALIGTRYACDTSGAAFTVTLPDSASTDIGAVVEVLDAKQTFLTNNLTVAVSGSDNIYESGQASSTTVVLSVNSSHRRFILGESLKWFVEAAGSGGLVSSNITADPAPALAGTEYHADTSGGVFTITLPTAPSDGSHIRILDASNSFNANNLQINRGGSDTIRGLIAPLVLDVYGQIVDLHYEATSADWKTALHLTPNAQVIQSVDDNETSGSVSGTFTSLFPSGNQTDIFGWKQGNNQDFTCPSGGDGRYLIVFDMNTSGHSGSETLANVIRVNGSDVASDTDFNAGAGNRNASCSVITNLVATDIITFGGFTTTSGTIVRQRISIQQLASSVLSNLARPAQYMQAGLSTIHTDVAVNTEFNFDTILDNSGDLISLSATSVFGLKANRTYKLTGQIRMPSTGPSGSQMTYIWRDLSNSINFGSVAVIGSTDLSDSNSSAATAVGIITPVSDITVGLRLTASSGAGVDADTDGSYAYIETISDNNNVSTFVGATTTTNGLQGVVPQPIAGDDGKVLSGAGTWISNTRTVSILPNEAQGYENHGFGFISSDDRVVTHGYGTTNLYMNSRHLAVGWHPISHTTDGDKTGTWAGLHQTYYNLIAWTTTGELWGGGFNSVGWFGDGTTTSNWLLHRLNDGVGPQNVSFARLTDSDSSNPTLHVLTSTGQVWAAGYNVHGQAVDGSFTHPRSSWNQVTGFTGNAVQISSGHSHLSALIIRTDQPTNNLWVAGYNGAGELGLGNTINQNTLQNVGENVVQVQTFYLNDTGGTGNTTILTTAGTIKTAGYNAHRVIGDNTAVNKSVFTQEALGKTDWVSFTGISDGNGASRMALDAGGNLYAWGWNDAGQLGLGDTTFRAQPTLVTPPWTGSVVRIRGGARTTASGYLVFTSDNECWYSGIGSNRQAAVGNLSTANATSFAKMPMPSDGSGWKDGVIVGLSTNTHLHLISNDGHLYAHGYANFGSTGVYDQTNSVAFPTPVDINRF